MSEKTLREQLYDKLSVEFGAFVENLKGLPPDRIIEASYEKAFKEDILMCFEYDDYRSDRETAALLALEEPLDALYRNWLDTDVSYMDDLRDTISGFVLRELERTGERDDNETAETPPVPVAAPEPEIPTTFAPNGRLHVGDWVIVRPDEAYGCLVGQVTAIDKAGSEEHDTDNPGDDVHVNFVALEYSEISKADLLEAFDGINPDAADFDDLPLDDVIMAPESLISLTGLDFDEIDKLSASYKAARAFGNRVLTETFDGLEQQLIARVEQNYADYNRMLLSFGQRELIDMAGKIAAMQDAYEYMTTSRGYSDNELRFYMQYACPLEIVADALIAYDADEEDIGFAMDFVIEHQESISPEYTKIVDAQPAAEPVKQPDRPKLPRANDTEPKPRSLTSQLDAATAEANERNAARTPQTQQKSKNKEID